jgi:glc operon protein GlcG
MITISRLTRLCCALYLSLGLVSGLAVSALQAQSQAPVLDLHTARLMADACEKLAREHGWKVAIAIHDQGGNLKYYSRMDGSLLLSASVAQLKSDTAARTVMPTQRLSEVIERAPGLAMVPGLSSLPGGLPIIGGNGAPLGGIGVSGASGEQDIACAQAGLDAVKGLLQAQ